MFVVKKMESDYTTPRFCANSQLLVTFNELKTVKSRFGGGQRKDLALTC
jgi:hypothetical protein